jgi:hypothetical protein
MALHLLAFGFIPMIQYFWWDATPMDIQYARGKYSSAYA